ncbi:MAG: serine/threonine-protein kinase [Acaryochloridaceae cyanobacterium RL_2_7]|nr:serine/threonine-protein kinase [Acaryochloridaceae cyanobacterium RL_2_7]
MFFFRYQMLEAIGSGQYGQVYKGLCLKTQEIVAIKELSMRAISTHHFIRELRTLSWNRHPNLVNLIGVEYSSEGRYLILEYCDQGTLRDSINDSLSMQFKLQLIQDILRGLSSLHAHGICHCDLKPENILLVQGGGRLHAKIADLGSAIRRDVFSNQKSLEPQTHLGSPAYMAPERF